MQNRKFRPSFSPHHRCSWMPV